MYHANNTSLPRAGEIDSYFTVCVTVMPAFIYTTTWAADGELPGSWVTASL